MKRKRSIQQKKEYRQGKYCVKNKTKYSGNHNDVWFRSSYELKLMKYLDMQERVIRWSSEEIVIPYRDPFSGKQRRYFPDFLVTIINNEGIRETLLIEVKPERFTRPPETQKRKTKKYLNEVHTWGINEAKWKAAESFCKKKGWKFEIFTEKHLGV